MQPVVEVIIHACLHAMGDGLADVVVGGGGVTVERHAFEDEVGGMTIDVADLGIDLVLAEAF